MIKAKNIFLLFTFYFLLFSVSPVFAQLPQVPGQPGALEQERRGNIEQNTRVTDLKLIIEQSGIFQTDIGSFVTAAVQASIAFGSLLCLAYLIWGAIDWLTSEGDKEKYTQARQKIMHAVMGLAILVCVFALWQLILHFFGLSAIFSSS